MKLELARLAAVVGAIRTPLALAGLIAIVLYVIYQQVLALPVFENIGANPTFLLLQNVIDKLFWLAIVALVLGVGSYIFIAALHRIDSKRTSEIEGMREQATEEGKLAIDDIIVSKKTGYLGLDVRVRNSGHKAINITRADLHILERMPFAASYKPSASYDLLVEGEHNIIPIAHIIQPSEVDSFILKVGFSKFNTSCGFRAELILHYNGQYVANSSEISFSSVM